ncbi:hypothetical protein [Parashewanella tropica]|uniref:hypothetical protein n=1 Tax=Parashewanella tropica TaxID=2547970 RepID=UPI001059C7AD|nr:hypothetical protein [Parashewanella tropica]
MKKGIIFLLSLWLVACSSTYPNQKIMQEFLPNMKGETLEKRSVIIPNDFKSPQTILLIGYVRNSQFDIDRWLQALKGTNVNTPTYELAAATGVMSSVFQDYINNGMRNGIPKEQWKGVVTLYDDAHVLQRFTGNHKPNNARVMLIDDKGKVLYFYDRGFSVDALESLKKKISK